MSSATGRKPTDAGSLLTGRRRIPYGDADFPAPQALPTSFLPTLPRQATPDVLPANIPSPLTPLSPLRPPPPRLTFSHHNLPPSLFVV